MGFWGYLGIVEYNMGLKPKSIPCVFAVLQLSEFVDHLTGLVSNTSKSG